MKLDIIQCFQNEKAGPLNGLLTVRTVDQKGEKTKPSLLSALHIVTVTVLLLVQHNQL